MSELSNQINEDVKSAMLAKEAVKLNALRQLKSAIKRFEVDNPGQDLTDEKVMSLIAKQIKQRHESIEQFEKANRSDLVDIEKAELETLESYLPKQVGDEELQSIVQSVVSENQLASKRDFGKAMKLIQEKLKGQADNRRISAELNKLLVG